MEGMWRFVYSFQRAQQTLNVNKQIAIVANHMPIRSTIRDKAYRMITTLAGDKENMVTLPILSGPARGLRIRADLIGRKDAYFWGKYDRYILQQVMPLVQQGWTVWDCGTYIGYYALLFARHVGPSGSVVAFDLDLRNLSRARQNAASNFLGNIEFVNAAIGAPSGTVEFILDETTNSHLPGNYIGGTEMASIWSQHDNNKPRGRVESVSFDQALVEKRLPKPDLIKVDIEGAEKVALNYGEYMFREVRPLLLLELHNPECDRAAWEFSRRFRYELKSLNTGQVLTNAEEVNGTLLCQPQ